MTSHVSDSVYEVNFKDVQKVQYHLPLWFVLHRIALAVIVFVIMPLVCYYGWLLHTVLGVEPGEIVFLLYFPPGALILIVTLLLGSAWRSYRHVLNESRKFHVDITDALESCCKKSFLSAWRCTAFGKAFKILSKAIKSIDFLDLISSVVYIFRWILTSILIFMGIKYSHSTMVDVGRFTTTGEKSPIVVFVALVVGILLWTLVVPHGRRATKRHQKRIREDKTLRVSKL